jgi:hypothetical protein
MVGAAQGCLLTGLILRLESGVFLPFVDVNPFDCVARGIDDHVGSGMNVAERIVSFVDGLGHFDLLARSF